MKSNIRVLSVTFSTPERYDGAADRPTFPPPLTFNYPMMPIIRTADIPEYYFEERCFIKELLNRADFPGLSIAQARVAPDETTVLHALTGTEVYYLLEGRGVVELDGEASPVAPGDLVHIVPHTAQRITNTGTTDLLFLAICQPRFRPEHYRVVE